MKVVALAALALTLGSTSAFAQDGGLPVGSVAPSVSLETLDGKRVELGPLLGKTPVVLEFWATWCGNCEELEPTFQEVQKKFAGRVRFASIAVAINQSPERVRRWVARHQPGRDVFYDYAGDAAERYDAPATSFVVIVDRQGRVTYTGVGGKQDLDAEIAKALGDRAP
ncbi:MAG TPA: TlpA disulfide reductase family protein [Gemmatimonadaceae bacterium]|nr:TlpA disulfide reductase family protein [Gemmatimonadaceae bacterium]